MMHARLLCQSLALCCAFALLPAGLAARDTPQVAFKDWAVECDDAPVYCVASQTAGATDDTFWLATVQLRPVTDGAIVVLRVPAGVHLGSGLFVGVRQPLTEIAYQSCTPQMCIASGQISKSELTRWRRGHVAEVRYRPSATSPPLSFEISLQGITAALRYVKEAEL